MAWQERAISASVLPITPDRIDGIRPFFVSGTPAGIELKYHRAVQLQDGEVRTSPKILQILRTEVVSPSGSVTVSDFMSWIMDQINTNEGLTNA